MAALAADRQGKFWGYHHKLFQSMSILSEGKIQDIARELGLDVDRFNKDLNDPGLQNLINRDLAEGMKAEVQGTPTLFVNGKPVKSGSLVALQQVIERELKGPGTVKPIQSRDIGNTGAATPAQIGDVAGNEKGMVVQPGDSADIHFLCRLQTGEVVAATDREAVQQAGLPKSAVFLMREKKDPLPVTAYTSLPEPSESREWAFEDEIINRLAVVVVGMREGESRTVNLTAEEVLDRAPEQYVIRVSRIRERQKEFRIPVGDFRARTGKSPEIGQPFFYDPAIPGEVEAVTEREVIIRFSAQPGDVVSTPFGQGRIRETEKAYEIVIDAQKGALVRSGHLVGRIAAVYEKYIIIDYRHPFGGETLSCDVKVEKARKGEAKEDRTAQKWGKVSNRLLRGFPWPQQEFSSPSITG